VSGYASVRLIIGGIVSIIVAYIGYRAAISGSKPKSGS
jgi:hypothetical protein